MRPAARQRGRFDSGVTFAREALDAPGNVLLAHCALGQARGPSMAYAVLLDKGYEPGEALLLITQARPEAKASYAEHALDWHLNRTGATQAGTGGGIRLAAGCTRTPAGLQRRRY